MKAPIHPVIYPGHHEKAVGGQCPFGGEQIDAAEIADASRPVPPLPADALITLQAVVIVLGLPVAVLQLVIHAMVFTLPGGSGKQAAAGKGKQGAVYFAGCGFVSLHGQKRHARPAGPWR